jgi:signal transduction histidine kinase
MIMAKIPFNVSARTARLIGRENVSNADGAIIELIKNSYDADAKKVLVVFIDNKDLYIIDNGHGMTKDVIQKAWMTIGTDNKALEPYSPDKRVKAGAKGIGRFALDRLGTAVEMYTLPKGKSTGYSWSINWNDFEKDGAVVSDIEANLDEIKGLNLEKKLQSLYLSNNIPNKIKFPEGGTIIKISFLRDNWTEEALKGLYQGLESLVPSVEKNSFSISLFSSLYPKEFGLVKPLINDDFDYKISASYDCKKKKVSIIMERNEFNISDLENKHGQVFDSSLMKSFPFDLATFKKEKFSQEYDVLNDLMKGFANQGNLLEKVGNFSFNLSFAKNSAPNKEDLRKYPYKNAEYSSRSEWLKKFGGIKIFRDNFRVRPYGETGEDWLKLGERQAQSPAGPGQRLGGFRVRPNQVAGAIHISRIDNENLQDKSSREGIQENDTFTVFKELIISIISLLEKDRNTIFYSLSELYKKINENERIKIEAREATTRINEKLKEVGGNSSLLSNSELKEDATKIADAFVVLESEIEEKHEEIKILRSLASAGLITAAVAHELRGLKNILLTRNKDLKKLIQPYITESNLKGVKDAFNPYILLSEMEKTDRDLYEWISYALTPLKRDKRLRKLVILKDYFEDLTNMWQHLLKERLITLIIDDFKKDFTVKAFTIDIDTILNNLIINSIESFSRKKDNAKRNIKISCVEDGEFYKIIYSDNGVGLDKSYKDRPSDIFLPQETTKRDNQGKIIGTGMGMYLVKSVIDDNRGKVEILSPKEGFSIALHLPIFSKQK